ncbi:MAG: RNA polymerase sigma factor [Anaerolineaceae bacterium]|nr:RNA polymerase sigma factor [Anaerolineaceae bacterium]
MKEARLLQSLSRLFHGEASETPLETPEAFSALYERDCLSVYRYLYGLHGGPAEDVEDLVAETFARAWKARRSFSGDPQTAGTAWLLGIARRLVIDAYRRSRARIQPEDGPLDEVPQLGPTPEGLVLAGEQREVLWRLLQRLPDEQREMLVLRYLLDWRVRQISQYLGIAENTVSVAMRRALVRLQREWLQGKE